MAKLAPAMALGAGLVALIFATKYSSTEMDRLAEQQDASPGEPNLLELYLAITENPQAYSPDEILGVADQLDKAGFPELAELLKDLLAGLMIPG